MRLTPTRKLLSACFTFSRSHSALLEMRIALHTGEQAKAARLVHARLTSAKLAAMLYLDLPQLKCICIPLKFIHGAPLLEICGSHFMYKTKFSMNKIVSLDQQFANHLCRHQLNFGDCVCLLISTT
jgi:hypothetical protein